jgi:hypothetical protein
MTIQNGYRQNDWTKWLDKMTIDKMTKDKMTRQNDYRQND